MSNYDKYDVFGSMFDDEFNLRGRRERQNSKWVDPRRTKDKWEYPYSYDEFYIWRRGSKEGCHGVYHDRMYQWDWDKYKAACAEVGEKRFDQYTYEDADKFLSYYFDKTIHTVALVEGCNVGNGYPYWVFFYKEIE